MVNVFDKLGLEGSTSPGLSAELQENMLIF
jgi:hypothetical protein